MTEPQPCFLVKGRRIKHYMGFDISSTAPPTDVVEAIGTIRIVNRNYRFVLDKDARVTLISIRTRRGAALKEPTAAQ